MKLKKKSICNSRINLKNSFRIIRGKIIIETKILDQKTKNGVLV